ETAFHQAPNTNHRYHWNSPTCFAHYHLMKPEPDSDLPELLRQRILRQRRRLKFVRVSFAITAVISVILLFAANQSQTLIPNARVLFVAPQGETLWIVDQHVDITNQK